jgi:hypothetical protein
LIKISITPWARFKAARRQAAVRGWLTSISKTAQSVFVAGMKGPHNGNVAKRKNGSVFLRSTPGQYPAVDSGALLASLKREVTPDEAKIGTSMFYAKWLRTGTRKMARRKMSDDAMKVGVAANKGGAKGWVGWRK